MEELKPYAARVVADSVTRSLGTDVRLTTLEVKFPRIVLAEFNTHRVFCLAGDALLEFDLPSPASSGGRRVFKMRLDEFVDKWIDGARRIGANPKKAVDLSWLDPSSWYPAPEIASRFGFANASNINALCRSGRLVAKKENGTWLVYGRSVAEWRETVPSHTRFDMKAKLAHMRIRQLNEDTGDVQTSRVVNACRSGTKPVFEVRAGEFAVAGSSDHRILTSEGWRSIREINPGDYVVVRKFGKREDDRLDPLRLKKIDGIWRSKWQAEQRKRLVSEDPMCRRCGIRHVEEIHHVVAVYIDPSRAFDESNVTGLCGECHADQHAIQGWQGGTYLYGALAQVTEVTLRGDEPTYDLEIAGDYPNFLANGVVVHNSRNSASSRAIPVDKRIVAISARPYVPEAFGKNKRGMQAGANLEGNEAEEARLIWIAAMQDALAHAEALSRIGVHKQWANRLLEPFAWHTCVVTSTEWDNFFALRAHPDAQPEIAKAAVSMREAMEASRPRRLLPGEWHLPYIGDDERGEVLGTLVAASAARCARVSYLTQDGRRDLAADLSLYSRLATAGHMSPLEHPAMAGWISVGSNAVPVYCTAEPKFGFAADFRVGPFIGNFRAPWIQHRKMVPGEAVFTGGQ